MNKKLKTFLLTILLILGLLGEATFLYVNDFNSASDEAISLVEEGTDGVRVIEDIGKSVQFIPTRGAKTALIFYPGGKVDYLAYSPLMAQLAKNGILCILVHMPGNLAVLDPDAADRYRSLYPEIKDWYIGGHSLGGVCAAEHLKKEYENYKGLILLGSYSTADLSDTKLKTLSLYGSKDQILDREEYEKNKDNLPSLTEYEITGANHSQFGDYGLQKGDGKATVSRERQMDLTVQWIRFFIEK